MLLIKIALVVLIAWTVCERWVWPKIKKQDPPERRGPVPNAQEAAKQYSDWLSIKSPSHAVYLEFGHGVLTPNEQREIVLQAVKDYAEKEGIPVIESAYKHGQNEEALEKRRKEREEARKMWAADVIIRHRK